MFKLFEILLIVQNVGGFAINAVKRLKVELSRSEDSKQRYTSKMLLAAIDECHRGTYDFNNGNVGYAFINMINPGLIILFYQVFNGKKWEKFNSEKVASLAYARIQGKAALIAHFQNSSLMNEDKHCKPISSSTPMALMPVPFPVGINIRNKVGRVRNNTQEDNLQGNLPNFANCKLSSDGDSHSLDSD
ncbi:Protein MEI2-like 4 [Glycine max]|nr:Protein MEI2-like 4 [Glycine max]